MTKVWVLLLFFSLISCSKEKVDYEDLVNIQGKYYKKYTNTPFTGITTGLKQGKIKKGKMYGDWKIYWKNGVIREILFIHNGKPDGRREVFDTKGELRFVKIYDKGNVKNEFNHFVYYENNQLKEEGYFFDDKKNGKWISYKENGDIRKMEHFTNNLLDGESVYYYKNGKVSEKGNYINGVPNGEWNDFFENGNLHILYSCLNNKKDGDFSLYDKEGSLMVEGTYKENKMTDTWTIYEKNGKIKRTGTFYGTVEDNLMGSEGFSLLCKKDRFIYR